MEPLCGSVSEGSKGSAHFQWAGSKGAVSPVGDEFYNLRYALAFPPWQSF